MAKIGKELEEVEVRPIREPLRREEPAPEKPEPKPQRKEEPVPARFADASARRA